MRSILKHVQQSDEIVLVHPYEKIPQLSYIKEKVCLVLFLSVPYLLSVMFSCYRKVTSVTRCRLLLAAVAASAQFAFAMQK